MNKKKKAYTGWKYKTEWAVRPVKDCIYGYCLSTSKRCPHYEGLADPIVVDTINNEQISDILCRYPNSVRFIRDKE